MGTLEDYKTATAMRDVVAKLINSEVEANRPRYKYATVVSIDRVGRSATVLYPDDIAPQAVAMGAIQPGAVGQIVRVDGLLGDRFISDVMGPVYTDTYVAPVTATSDWVNIGAFSNGWLNLGSPNETAGYCIDGEGWVHLKGVLTAGTNSTIAFNLPIGFRPRLDMFFTVSCNSTFGQVFIDSTTGAVTLVVALGSTAYISLDGIQFPTAVLATLGPLTTQVPQFSNYNITGGFNPGWVVRDNGFIYPVGLIGAAPAASYAYDFNPANLDVRSYVFGALGYSGAAYVAQRLDITRGSLASTAFQTGATAFQTLTGLEVPTMSLQTSWVGATFSNSWANYGTDVTNLWANAGYYKDKYGFVHLRGLVKNGTSATATMFNLPTGFRPVATLIFPQNSFAGPCRIHVNSAGNVSAAAGGSTTYTSLSGIHFRADA